MKLSITKYDMWMYFDGNELNDKYSNITELTIEGLKKTEREFLSHNTTLKKISLPDVVEVEYRFLANNEVLEDIYLPQVKTIGFSFLSENSALKKIVLPNVQKIESWFLQKNNQIRSINFPELRVIGESFMYDNEVLEEAILPNVTEIGDDFLWTNRNLKKLFVPKLEKKGSNFLAMNSMYQKIEGEEDLTFRKSITNELKGKIYDFYNLSNNIHADLVKIQNNLKEIINEFGKDYGKNTNIYHHDSCFSLHRQINDFLISKLTMKYNDSLRELSDLFESTIDFNIYINNLIDDISKSIQFDPDILMVILNTIQAMADSANISSGYDSCNIFENNSSKLTNIIQDITQSFTITYFLTIRFIKCTLGNDEAQKLLNRSTDDVLKNIAFSVIVDRRFLPFVADKINGKDLKSHTIKELLEIENQIYKDFIEYIKQDFYSFKYDGDNSIQDDEDFNNEVNTNLCPNCGSVLDDDNWCDECCEFFDIEDKEGKDSVDAYNNNLCSKCGGILDEDNWCVDCLDFVEPIKDEFSKTLEWLLEDDIEKTNTLKTKKVDSIYNLEYQYNSTNKSIVLYEIPYDELISGSRKYEQDKYGSIKPVFFEFYENEYMYDGGMFIKTVNKKELVNGKKVLRLSDSFIWNDEKKNELNCIEESLETNKYKIRNMIKKCPICGEFEYTPDDFSCDVCGWFFSTISEKYKDYQGSDNGSSFNEYKLWWIEKRKLDVNFIISDDESSHPLENDMIKMKEFQNWQYSLMQNSGVIIRGHHCDDDSDGDVKVPSKIEGKPVVGISGDSIYGFIVSVLLPDTIKVIESSAIKSYCDMKIFIPNSIEYIAKEAFGDATLYIESDQIPIEWDKDFDLSSESGEKNTFILGAKKENFL